MRNNLDGSSALTSDVAILIYYACAVLALFTGFFGIIALVGAIVTRSVATKENAKLVAAHCTWITRSIWINITAIIIVTIAIIAYLGTGDTTALENTNLDSIDSIEALWNNPAMNSVLTSLFAGMAVMLVVFAWYLYRMIRGTLAVFRSRAPKG